jgi:hypothetical protein
MVQRAAGVSAGGRCGCRAEPECRERNSQPGLECFRLDEGRYTLQATGTGNEVVEVPDFPPLDFRARRRNDPRRVSPGPCAAERAVPRATAR